MADGICNNCGASLAGPYCHRCGQKEADTDWHSLRYIARQFWDELVSLDYKSVRTVAALFRPGHLAHEFIDGRRSRYLTPLKTYLLAAAVFFVIAPRTTDFTFERRLELDREGTFRTHVEARMRESGVSRELFADRFERNMQTIYTLMPIVSVFALTLLLRAFFGRRFPWVGPHLVVALYHAAFAFAIALLLHAVNHRFTPNVLVLFAVQYAILLPYLFVTLRRVYAQPPRRTLAKAAAILALAFLIDSPLNVTAVMLTVRIT